MYLQTSRLQYNLQGFGVFQKALSDNNIQAEACKDIVPQKRLFRKFIQLFVISLKMPLATAMLFTI